MLQHIFWLVSWICLGILYVIIIWHLVQQLLYFLQLLSRILTRFLSNKINLSGSPADWQLSWSVIVFLGSATRHICCGTYGESCQFCTCSQWLWWNFLRLFLRRQDPKYIFFRNACQRRVGWENLPDINIFNQPWICQNNAYCIIFS